jgi:hypothetical protein
MSWQPFTYLTPVTSQSGSIAAAPFFTAPATSYYILSVYMSPATAVLASTATLTINFIENGVARSITTTALTLTTLTGAISNYLMIRADALTPVTYSVTALGTGTYNVHLGWKPQGS